MDIFDKTPDDGFIWKRNLWVLPISIMVLPLVLKKHLAELKIASLILFAGTFAFVVLTGIQLARGLPDDPTVPVEPVNDETLEDWWIPRPDKLRFWAYMSTCFVAFGYQAAFFAIRNSMKDPSPKECLKFVTFGAGFCYLVYLGTGFIGVYLFGT